MHKASQNLQSEVTYALVAGVVVTGAGAIGGALIGNHSYPNNFKSSFSSTLAGIGVAIIASSILLTVYKRSGRK